MCWGSLFFCFYSSEGLGLDLRQCPISGIACGHNRWHGRMVADLGGWEFMGDSWLSGYITHRIHGAAIYGNMDPINIPPLC